MSVFSNVQLAPPDPILGIGEAFKADPRANKVNLSVGVYADDNGKLPLLECVKQAEELIESKPAPRPYLPMDGMTSFDAVCRDLVFGAGSEAVAQGRVVTAQSLAGSGALKLGGDFIRNTISNGKMLVSDPTWGNHLGIFGSSGFEIGKFRYYDEANHAVDFDGMLADMKAADPGTVVVLHNCCHNPTGYDLSQEQWSEVIAILGANQLIGFFDMAYQGFARSTEQDNFPIRAAAEAGLNFLVANSFSKTFSLYGERIGALSVVCATPEEAATVLSQIKIAVRQNYSNPPTHGAAIVVTVLNDPKLTATWQTELGVMRERIRTMRQAFVAELITAEAPGNWDFILQQNGMFSFSGLSKEQVEQLKTEYAIYAIGNGRISIPGLNAENVAYVAKAVAAVLK
jgi:aromatic-amino-acid transaminase